MLSAIILLILQANLLPFIQSTCLNNGNYTNNSPYRDNLNTVLSSLPVNIDRNGFYYASVGQYPDRANAVALCRGDVQLHTCRGCIQNITAGLLTSCPNQKQAIEWYELCMLRYSTETILGTLATSPRYWWWNPTNATSYEQFKADLRTLLDNLRGRAAFGDPLRKVAAGNVTAPDFQSIYALVQCTPDLSPDDCSRCLIEAAQDIPTCCDGKRGGFKNLRLRLSHPPKPPLLSPPGEGDGNNTTRIVIIIVVSIVACVILALFVGILLRKRIKRKPPETPETADDIRTTESLKYALSTIKDATNDFSNDNKLGQGGFGAVYKGKFQNGEEIAIKRLSKDLGQGDLEFKNEVLLLAKLQHRNLVRLLGFCLEGMEKLLIYEFVQNASLDLLKFDPTKHTYLDWERRYKIIGGIARGILYLHEDSQLTIIHRDLKPSNVLLDGSMNPKIADFGMARLFGQDETQEYASKIAGPSNGYMAPEYAMHGQFSIKSDVFSFGVLVLEIISGQRNNGLRRGENVEDLLSFAWKNWRDRTTANMVDPFLRSSSGFMSDMVRCIHIGLLCVQENAADRPKMASVILMLNSFSLTLAVPIEPAFYLPSDYGSDTSHLQEHNSREPEYNNSSKSNILAQSDHSSRNDASITDLYPR
ncbi:hypothetical protein DH2020_042210 [Rehmannia glutinosa]|uniref:Cysteine-rich receptor-like protein kinase n=1 Tax=Rehmannia glutinosa TaxID=99300 RepID=A0ABR0UPD5_REHGL